MSPFFKFLLILERERKGGRGREKEIERERFVVPLIYAFIGWLWYVPWLDIKPTTLVDRDDALTNWVTWPGPVWVLYKFWILTPYQMYHWWIYSPIQWAGFLFCWWFPLLCKNFWVQCSPICLFFLLFPLPKEIYQKKYGKKKYQRFLLPMFSSRNFYSFESYI